MCVCVRGDGCGVRTSLYYGGVSPSLFVLFVRTFVSFYYFHYSSLHSICFSCLAFVHCFSLSLSGCRNICSENSHRSFFPVDLSAKEGHVQHTARCLLCCFLPGSERKGEHSFACSFLALFFLFVCQCCLHIRSPSL